VTGDAFDGVFPPGRGTNGRHDSLELRLPRELARRLVAALGTGHGSRSLLQRICQERRWAAELGLELQPGYWRCCDGNDQWGLTAIYFDDEFVGFSELTDADCRLLRFD
jgi:hypothetical protein